NAKVFIKARSKFKNTFARKFMREITCFSRSAKLGLNDPRKESTRYAFTVEFIRVAAGASCSGKVSGRSWLTGTSNFSSLATAQDISTLSGGVKPSLQPV